MGRELLTREIRLDFYFCLIKYMLNPIRYFKGLVFAAAFFDRRVSIPVLMRNMLQNCKRFDISEHSNSKSDVIISLR